VQLHSDISTVAVIDPHDKLHIAGSKDGPFAWASITKVLTAYVFADAVADGVIAFEDETTIPGITFADLLSHASGIRAGDEASIEPRTKRIYTNEAYDIAERELINALGAGFEDVTVAQLFADGISQAWDSTIVMRDSCAHSAFGTFDDLVILLREMRQPRVVDPAIHAQLTQPYLPNLSGVVPGWGHFTHCVWGIGYEIHAEKKDHWMGTLLSPESFGHFGMSGSFVVHDPIQNISIACSSRKDFGPWAKKVWPALVDELVKQYAN
jgi:CubicO group peptidase (beta-lactamase class C family)